jgi:hypothetical protein
MAAPDPSERRRHVQRFLLVLSAWTAVSVIFGLILSLQVPLPLRYAFVSSFAWYYSVGVIVWIACGADRRLGLWRRPLTSALIRSVPTDRSRGKTTGLTSALRGSRRVTPVIR